MKRLVHFLAQYRMCQSAERNTMSTDWVAALKGIIECMGKIAVEASQLRGELRKLAQALLDATEESPTTVDAPAPSNTSTAAEDAGTEVDVEPAQVAAPAAPPAPLLSTEARPADFSVKDNGSPATESAPSIPNFVKMPKPPTPPAYAGAVRPVPARELPTAFTRDEPREAAGDGNSTASPFPRYVPGKWGAPTDEEFPHL